MKNVRRIAYAGVNELTAQELSIEELEMVAGGEEADEISFPGGDIAIGALVIVLLVNKYILLSFETLWTWIDNHQKDVVIMLLLYDPKLGFEYAIWSQSKKREYWRQVCNRLPG